MRPAALTALHDTLAVIAPETRTQRVPFLQALHRIAAEEVALIEDRPRCARAARAGWAVHPGDLPRTVVDAIPSEGALPPALPRGAAAAVAVGSPVDAGWAVVPSPGDDAPAGTGILRPGASATAGTVLVRAGDHLDPVHLGLAAWAGRDEIAIVAPVRTVILVPEPPEGGDAAGALLLAWCIGWGLPASRHRLPGEPPLRLEALGNAVDRARVVVVASGGACLEPAQRHLGFQPLPVPDAVPDAGLALRHSGTVLVDLPADHDRALLAAHLLLWPLLARLGSLPEPAWSPAKEAGPGLHPWPPPAAGLPPWSAAGGVSWDGAWLAWCHGSGPRP
ncbi:MAG: hypothetical protein RLZZ127_3217 [Planctomycetota bacterium]